MKSSSGAHFIAVDHIRALAAFLVFTWHFLHAWNGYPVSFNEVPPLFIASVLNQGHTGVALFMTLSGYLFAKLLNGRSIHYGTFLWNRALRLLPLLLLVILTVGVQRFLSDASLLDYAISIGKGTFFPTLPNGGWSITVEFHFYLALPFLLWWQRASKLSLLLLVVTAIALRFYLYRELGEIQSLSYWTIVGRIDQFVLGMLGFHFSQQFKHRHAVASIVLVSFMVFYWSFDMQGGFYRNPSYPSSDPLWIYLPTIEGIAYAIGIAWYDTSFSHSTAGFSKFVGRLGEYSYSIYLLHFFFVFEAARLVNEWIMDISSFHLAVPWAVLCFILMAVPGYLCFRFIEEPFLRLRKDYLNSNKQVESH